MEKEKEGTLTNEVKEAKEAKEAKETKEAKEAKEAKNNHTNENKILIRIINPLVQMAHKLKHTKKYRKSHRKHSSARRTRSRHGGICAVPRR